MEMLICLTTYLSSYLSVCLSIYLFIYLSIYLSIYLCIYIYITFDYNGLSLVHSESVCFSLPRICLHGRYAFDYGSVHFLVMSTEHDFRQGSLQYQYLSNELASVDRSITPWLVFAGHR